MKYATRILLLVLLFFANTKMHAQIKEGGQEIFMATEQAASFPGGEKAMSKFIGKNLQYPKIAREAGIVGMVYVEFVVNKDGSLSNCKVVRDIGGNCGKAVVNMVNEMPNWEPAKNNGIAVRAFYTLPVSFEQDDRPSRKERKAARKKAREAKKK